MPSWTVADTADREVGSLSLSTRPSAERANKKAKPRKSKRIEAGQKDGGHLPGDDESAQLLINLSRASLNFGEKALARDGEGTGSEGVEAVEHGDRNDSTGGATAKSTNMGKKKSGGTEKSRRRKRKHVEESVDAAVPDESSQPPKSQQETTSWENTRPANHTNDDDEFLQQIESGINSFGRENSFHVSGGPALRDDLEMTSGAIEEPATRSDKDAGKPKRRKRKSTYGRRSDFLAQPVITQEVPIDPELHSIDAAASQNARGSQAIATPSQSYKNMNRSRGDKNDSSRYNDVDEQRSWAHDQTISSNGQRNEESNLMDDNADEPLLGLEDEMHQMSRNIGTPYTEDTDVEELRRQHENSTSKSSTKRRKNADTPGRSSTSKIGFTDEEVVRLDRFRENYCQVNDVSGQQFNELIQSNIRGNHRAVNLFNEIQGMYPTRTRSYVQRFCRRRYHNFHARGVWTVDEDEGLKRAVAEKGTSWKVIGEMLDRFAEDCRDRYRNYLHPSAQHRNRDAWTEIEVVHLSQAILDCMAKTREAQHEQEQEQLGYAVPMADVDSDQEAEDMKFVNWQKVSERMDQYGSSRSRLQCSFKWGKIKDEDRRRYLKEIKQAQRSSTALRPDNFTANNMKTSSGWRLKRASKKVLNMKGGDRYDLLRGILDAGSATEENIPWRFVGDDGFRQKWTTTERRAAWLMLKDEIQTSEEIDYRYLIHQLLTKVLSDQDIAIRWDPEKHGWVEGSMEKRSNRSKKDKTAQADNPSQTDHQEDEAFIGIGHQRLPAPMAPILDSTGALGTDTRSPEGNGRLSGNGAGRLRDFSAERSNSPDSLFDDRDSPSFTRKQARHVSSNQSAGRVVSPALANAVMTLQEYSGEKGQER